MYHLLMLALLTIEVQKAQVAAVVNLFLSKVVTEVLTNSLKDITGGHVIVNPDPKSSADQLEEIIIDRRQKLGLKDVVSYA